ncbi:MAG: recombination mediator protein UvsY [Candidatus Pacebacteria bacterium]|jgi:hypothetical protein|nr:recombination mediator protein UvsY [Candidatus Paceibacterota bacterium]|tara:strand:- start:811 stop:1236 length:426 start_codon:yes stop_codon:yes gene_type:complete
MRFDELSEMVDKDLKIDDTELDLESIRTPQLHNKYLKFYTQFSLQLKKIRDERKVLYRQKWEYYTGKSDPEVYRDNPFDIKVLRADLDIYLNSDTELQEISQKEEYIKTMVEYTERILKEINNRNWNIRNTIEWKKFLHGE